MGAAIDEQPPPVEPGPGKASDHAGRWAKLRQWLPRPETTILLVALAWTLAAKRVVINHHQPANVLIAWADIALYDLAFFAAIALITWLLYAYKPRALLARVALAVAGAALLWSVLNAAWLIATGVQLQPGVLGALAHDPLQFWPVVQSYLTRNLHYSIPIGLTVVGFAVWFGWRFVRPAPVASTRRCLAVKALVASVVLAGSLLLQPLCRGASGLGFTSEVLGFSSHWGALEAMTFGHARFAEIERQIRPLPRAGQRKVGPPTVAPEDLPNIVLLMLESVAYRHTSLVDPSRPTPTLTKLASEGVSFSLTRVPVSQTTKAFWAALTGTMPDVQPDYVEAVLADEPYEGLISILARHGYRSAFFQVSQGRFECAPALFDNLGFDWAWFLENLEDPSAQLGIFSGDDFRMIEPAFKWVDDGAKPFVLMMITSVTHEPYLVPAWFGAPQTAPADNMHQALRYTDDFVQEVCGQLQRRGLYDNTILCVMGDHGETMRTHGRPSRWVPYEEVLHVPWIIRWPGHVEPGIRIDSPCSQLDVTPTLLKLLGCDVSEAGFEGENAFTYNDPQRRLYFSSWFAGSPLGFIEGSRKWLYWPYRDSVLQYDLEADPDEQSPVRVSGAEKDRVVSELIEWQQRSQFVIHPRRFRQRLLFEHWRTFSSGRLSWTYYVP